jgi:glycosyltransferase involved in cell wall biosynthesis
MRILVLIQGSLGDRQAGPEIRGWEIVRALSSKHSVTAAAAVPEPTTREGVPVVPRSRRSILKELRRNDAILGSAIPPYALAANPSCLRVADLYDPVELELGTAEGWRAGRQAALQRAHRRLQLRWADVVMCANNRQLEAIRSDLETIDRPVPARTLTVPMGLPAPPQLADAHPLRERFEAIGANDPLVLWWGSAWRWLDAPAAVEAIGMLAERRPNLRLVITAGRPSNTATDQLNATEEVRALARERGLLDRHVFFLDEWVPFNERHLYLADADLGIALHADTPEAALAARARYMDFIWASLPSVLTEGDEVADQLARAGAASLVPPRDITAIAAEIDGLLADRDRLDAARWACQEVAAEFQWPELLAPLVDCLEQSSPSDRSALQGLHAAGQAGRFYARRLVDYALSAD